MLISLPSKPNLGNLFGKTFNSNLEALLHRSANASRNSDPNESQAGELSLPIQSLINRNSIMVSLKILILKTSKLSSIG